MLTYVKISGFKSFHDFEMEFTPFTVIAGANASGKSNLFDALSLLSRLAEPVSYFTNTDGVSGHCTRIQHPGPSIDALP